MVDALTAPLFKALARLRGARAFHPRGAAYAASWVPADHVRLRDGDAGTAQEHDAIVRVSRGVGLPPALPDVLGVAVRVIDLHGRDQHQDLLLASVAGAGLGSRVLVPRRTFSTTAFLAAALPGQRRADPADGHRRR